MKTLVTDQEIVRTALAWEATLREALTLRAQRNAIACELEAASITAESGPLLGEPPCWKRTTTDPGWGGYPEPRRLEPEEWCGPCQRRGEVQALYRRTVNRRGALLRSLRRLCGQRLRPSP